MKSNKTSFSVQDIPFRGRTIVLTQDGPWKDTFWDNSARQQDKYYGSVLRIESDIFSLDCRNGIIAAETRDDPAGQKLCETFDTVRLCHNSGDLADFADGCDCKNGSYYISRGGSIAMAVDGTGYSYSRKGASADDEARSTVLFFRTERQSDGSSYLDADGCLDESGIARLKADYKANLAFPVSTDLSRRAFLSACGLPETSVFADNPFSPETGERLASLLNSASCRRNESARITPRQASAVLRNLLNGFAVIDTGEGVSIRGDDMQGFLPGRLHIDGAAVSDFAGLGKSMLRFTGTKDEILLCSGLVGTVRKARVRRCLDFKRPSPEKTEETREKN